MLTLPDRPAVTAMCGMRLHGLFHALHLTSMHAVHAHKPCRQEWPNRRKAAALVLSPPAAAVGAHMAEACKRRIAGPQAGGAR